MQHISYQKTLWKSFKNTWFCGLYPCAFDLVVGGIQLALCILKRIPQPSEGVNWPGLKCFPGPVYNILFVAERRTGNVFWKSIVCLSPFFFIFWNVVWATYDLHFATRESRGPGKWRENRGKSRQEGMNWDANGSRSSHEHRVTCSMAVGKVYWNGKIYWKLVYFLGVFRGSLPQVTLLSWTGDCCFPCTASLRYHCLLCILSTST